MEAYIDLLEAYKDAVSDMRSQLELSALDDFDLNQSLQKLVELEAKFQARGLDIYVSFISGKTISGPLIPPENGAI